MALSKTRFRYNYWAIEWGEEICPEAQEITPEKVHPVLRKTIHTLFEEMEAKGEN